MDNFLRKINFIKDITVQLPVSKMDFIEKFRNNVDQSNFGYVPFEVLQYSRNEYKGNIDNNGFELKKRKKLFDINYSFAKVTGRLVTQHDQLIVKAVISCFRKRMIFFLALILFFYFLLITDAVSNGETTIALFMIPFMLLQLLLIIGLPYFIIRRSVNRMAYDLERDFHYWVTKN